MEFFGHTVAAQHRIEIEEVVSGDPFIEAHFTGRQGIAGEDGASWHVGRVLVAVFAIEVPFAEVPRGITRRLQHLRDGQFLGADGGTRIESAHAIRVPSGHDAGTRRRAVEVRGVEAVEAQTTLRE